MRHSIPKWIVMLLTAVGDETQRSGVKFLGETKTSHFLPLLLRFSFFDIVDESKGIASYFKKSF